MAYFSNGTEFEHWSMANCDVCVHDNEETGCRVMLVHDLYNYSQGDYEPVETILSLLIPRRPDGLYNMPCAMLIKVDA